MKKSGKAIALILAFAAGSMLSAQLRDWHDLEAVHKHVLEAIHEMEYARSANHYDMKGTASKQRRTSELPSVNSVSQSTPPKPRLTKPVTMNLDLR